MLRIINKKLQRLAILLQVFWLFFPGILFLIIGYFFFNESAQGKDIIITGLRSRQTGLLFVAGLLFWSIVNWYTSRLIAYNNDRLFHIAKVELYQTPRLLGFLSFAIISCALVGIKFEYENEIVNLLLLTANIILFFILHNLFEKIKNKLDREQLKKYRKITLIISLLLIASIVAINTIEYYISLLPMLQILYLYIVITRRKISQSNSSGNKFPEQRYLQQARKKYRKFIEWVFYDRARPYDPLKNEIMVQTEKNIFFRFSLFSLISLGIYIAAVYSLEIARQITALPIILLSFGILLGAGNIIALFSIKQKISFHFLFIVILVIAGFFREPHFVNLRNNPPKNDLANERPKLKSHFSDWLNERKQALNDSNNKIFPVYFILADGGASRSAYWTASVLSKIEEETKGKLSKNMYCLSGASGGSLGNLTYYASQQLELQNKTKSVQEYLSNDFLSFPLVRLLGPDLILPLIPKGVIRDRADALERSITDVETGNIIGSYMNENFSRLIQKENSGSIDPVICINCTRMQDGVPAVISNVRLNTDIATSRVDVLGLLQPNQDISIAASIVLGARFPYFSPAGRIQDQYFVDGGYFDNSGAGVVHEMILDLNKMINDTLQKDPKHSYHKIRFHVIHVSNHLETGEKFSRVHPLVNDLVAPIKTILGSYASQTNINNLRLTKNLQDIYRSDDYYTMINLFEKDQEEEYPMNWSISSQSLEKIKSRLNTNKTLTDLINRINSKN